MNSPEPGSEKLSSQENEFNKESPPPLRAVTTEAVAKPQDSLAPVSFVQLFRFSTRGELALNAVGFFAAILAGAAQPLMTLFFGNLTQQFIEFGTALANLNPDDPTSIANIDHARSNFRSVAAKDASNIVYIGVGIFVCTYVYMILWVYTGEKGSKRIRELYLKAVLRQDIAFFDTVGAGEIATRIQTDTHLVQLAISEKVALCGSYVSAFCTAYVIAYIRSWRLALAMTCILPCIGLAGGFMNKFVAKYTQLSLNYVAEGGTVAEEVLSTVRTAHAFGNQRVLSNLYRNHVEKAHLADLKTAIFRGIGMSMFFFVIYNAYAVAFTCGTTLLIRHLITPGVIINVILAILIGSFSLSFLTPEMQNIMRGRGAAAKLYATIDRVPPIDSEDQSGKKLDSVSGHVEFENVSFHYPSRSDVPVIKNLNITFPAGKTCALVGASGSGKSTVVSLIERFYDPIQGCVRLDGVKIKDLNLKWLRRQIGLVSQEPVLFATTIKGNVAHGLIGSKWEHSSEAEKFALIKEACIKANADGFIQKLPLGYDTMVGERGFLLSGGQKQRIAIARAIVSDPKILLLDEATSALDTQSEGVVQDALDKAAAGRTTITIAHRLSTIKDADQIFVMGDGVVLEHGTHGELLRKEGGAYGKLVLAQRLREESGRTGEKDGLDDGSSIEGSAEMSAVRNDDGDGLKLSKTRSRSNTVASGKSALLKRPQDEHEYGLLYLFKRMGDIQRVVRHKYFIGSVFSILMGMIYPAFGILYAKSITTFQTQDNHELRAKGDRNALWFFVIALLATIIVGIQNYMFAAAAANLTFYLRSMSFRALLRQDIEFFDEDQNNPGTLTSSLSDNAEKINGLAGITMASIVQGFSTIVCGTIIGLIFSWKLSLVGVACMPFLITTGYIRLRVVVLKDKVNKKEHEESAHIATEAAAAIRTVASLTREEDCCNIYSACLEGPLRRSNQSSIWSDLFYALSTSAQFFAIALVFWYGSILISAGEFSNTAFFVCLFSTTFAAIQVGQIFAWVPDISAAKGAAADVVKLLDSMPTIDAESSEGNVPKDVMGRITLQNIHFRYPTRPSIPVLRGLSLKIEPGTFVALVGASGCGKSTVIQLMERFYDPLSGKITLDGQDISGLNVQEYRKQMALVSQEPTLYAGTVMFNILLGAIKPQSEVTQEEVEAACRSANILDFIQSLPKGFDTEVGGKGSQLSGGQKQRIAIARALLRNPKVLLLDEATSALDSHSERVVQDALDRAAKGRTTIAIAHRLSSIQNADCIYFIKDGVVSESGTHDQLLALRGGYYEFVQLQALSKR